MTVARTTLLDLPIITTGTESGLWGDYTNNGLTQYLDISIAGMSNLTSANFTAGALTIETTEGTNSATNIVATSAQYAGFRVSSLATDSTITVGNTGTNPGRSYRLINADSTYTLTFKATGQTGITLQPGQSAVVAFNGTDYGIVGTIGPTVPVNRGGTGATTLTANNVILGNGTSAVQFVAPGSNGNVLTSNGTTWTSSAISGFVTASANNAFTGANTFYNATGQTFAQTSTNDGIVLQGRAGGSSSYRVTFTTGTLSASRTVTLPNADINFTTGLDVANGGTGATTLTSNNVILGNGTSAVQFVAPGTTGNVLVSNGTTWTSAAPAGAPNLQEFTSSGTWTKPSGATFVYVELWGAGGGGGSGRRGAAGTERSGGGGGGGGALARYMFRASDLGATVTVTLGTGGTAGAAQTSDDTNGANGANGGNTTFGSVLTAYGGGGGAGGGTTSGAGGSGGGTGSAGSLGSASNLGGSPSFTYVGGNAALGANGTQNTLGGGGALSTASGSGDSGHAEFGGGAGGNRQSAGSSIYGSGGGGAGGWINSGNTAITGRTGGGTNSYTAGGTGAGSGGALGTAGTAGTQSTSRGAAGGGGGGGASITGAAGAGAAGGQGGGGGGGGGASLNGNNSGAGGAGGTGYCRVYTW